MLIFRNTQQINNKLDGQPITKNDLKNPHVINNISSVQSQEPSAEKEPDYRFCSQCGTKYDANKGGCPNGCEKSV